MAVFFSLTSGVFLDIFDISNQGIAMPARTTANQIAFRYRSVDSSTGYLGVDETQAIHQALRELAIKLLPQYEADNGPLTAIQLRQIKKIVPQATKRSVRSSLFEDVIA